MTTESNKADFSRLLASSVHDMKNSTAFLLNGLETALNDLPEADSPLRTQLVHMLYEARRVNGNLVQLLGLYKLGTSTYPVDISPCPVDEFLREVVAQNRPMLDFKRIRMEVDCAFDDEFYFDRDLVGSALGNAINNACRYAREKIRLSAHARDGFLELRVDDDGAGFPDGMIAIGNNLAGGIDFVTGSTGLGLYFAAEIGRLHRNGGVAGSVTLENGGPFGGGCFIMRLP